MNQEYLAINLIRLAVLKGYKVSFVKKEQSDEIKICVSGRHDNQLFEYHSSQYHFNSLIINHLEWLLTDFKGDSK